VEFLSINSSPVFCYVICTRPETLPQRFSLRTPYSLFSRNNWRPSFTSAAEQR